MKARAICFALSEVILINCLNQPAYAVNADALTQSFVSKKYHYAILYPVNWRYTDRGNGVVVFKGTSKDNQPLMINIQTLLTKKAGGEYATIHDLMSDFYSQVPKHTAQATFLERKPVVFIEPDGTKLEGEETTLTFYENHQTFKQWQVMVLSHDGRLFQAWAYRAPEPIYALYQPLAASILQSWVID